MENLSEQESEIMDQVKSLIASTENESTLKDAYQSLSIILKLMQEKKPTSIFMLVNFGDNTAMLGHGSTATIAQSFAAALETPKFIEALATALVAKQQKL